MQFLKSLAALVLVLLLSMSSGSCKKETDEQPQQMGSSDTTMLNVVYGPDERNVYDIYLPAERDLNTPVILMVHGGAWVAGQKEDFNGYINLIRSRWEEVAIVNMNYRLASNEDSVHHEEIMEDIQAAVEHIKSQGSNYKISDQIGMLGASAGAHLSMIYAYRYDSSIKCIGDIFGPTIINDWTWYNSNNIWLGGKVGDILAEYVGQTWDSTAYAAVSPFWQVSASSQPTIIFHGNLDPIVPIYHSQSLRNKLNSLDVAHEYHEYVAFHGFNGTQSADVVEKLVAFFKTHLE